MKLSQLFQMRLILMQTLRRMLNGSRLRQRGSLLCLLLAFPLNSCRDDAPPAITVCLGDGTGGAKCVSPTGMQISLTPSQLTNYFMLSPTDAKNFTSFCYDTDENTAQAAMQFVQKQALK